MSTRGRLAVLICEVDGRVRVEPSRAEPASKPAGAEAGAGAVCLPVLANTVTFSSVLLSRTSCSTTLGRRYAVSPNFIPPQMSKRKKKEEEETRFFLSTVHLKEFCLLWNLEIDSYEEFFRNSSMNLP